jgi:hypothetical protein
VTTPDETPIACTLDEAALRQRRAEIRAGIARQVAVTLELSDGLAFGFPASPALRAELDEFVAFERACCGFADFQVRAGPEADRLWLEVRGPEGTADFVRGMLDDDVRDPTPTQAPSRDTRLVKLGVRGLGGAFVALLLCETPLLAALLVASGLGAASADVAPWLDAVAAALLAGSLCLLGLVLYRRHVSRRTAQGQAASRQVEAGSL